MSETDARIFRLKDDIRILKDHLYYEEHPDKYSLVKTPEKRQEHIAFIRSRIVMKEEELNKLQNQ